MVKGNLKKIDLLRKRRDSNFIAEPYFIDTKKFIKKGIYTEKIENTENNNVDNFKVYNKDKFIGIVISSYNKTGQTIIEVKMNDKLVLIPFVDDFINQISEDEIYMTLPDGLLDIN